MQAHVYTGARPIASGERRRYSHKAQFVADWREHSRPLDRTQRHRIMFLAEALELRTKREGCRNGVLGYIGLRVLKALLYEFQNRVTGYLAPSYDAIRKKTGLCKQSIANAIADLERSGIIRVVRRVVRQQVQRVNAITHQAETIETTVQASNFYSVWQPGWWTDGWRAVADPKKDKTPYRTCGGRRAPFPTAKQLAFWRRVKSAMDLPIPSASQPSPSARESRARTSAKTIAELLWER